MNEKKKWSFLVLVASLVIFFSFGNYTLKVDTTLKENSASMMRDTAEQSLKLIQSKIENHYIYLESVAAMIASFDSITDPKVFELLHTQKENQLFERMIVCTQDGIAHAVDGNTYDVSKKTYYQRVMLGARELTDVENSLTDAEPGVIFAVPIKKDGKIIGALQSDYPQELLKQFFRIKVLDGKGKVNIIKSDGTIVFPQGGLEEEANYFDLLAKAQILHDRTVQSIKQSMQGHQKGIIEFNYKDEGRYVDYAPVGVNNWYILVGVPINLVKVQAEQFSRYGLLLVIEVGTALLLAFIGMLFLQKKANIELKKTQEDIRLSEERYRLIMEKSDGIIYDWNIIDDTVKFSDVWEKRMGYQPPSEQFYQAARTRRIIHLEDLERYITLLTKIREGLSYGEEKIRIWDGKGDYTWMRTSLMSIQDSDGKTCRALGINIDIDREMQENQTLKVKAEKDPLTGIYNKGATEAAIQKIFIDTELRADQEIQHAFIILDLDNFKQVNDVLGHAIGDKVLEETAKRACDFFRKEDVVGRIGGDEFVILLNEAKKKEDIEQRAEAFCASFHQAFPEVTGDIDLSVSMGIAIYRQDASTYQELYQKADMALYQAKRSGKNRYCFYQDESFDYQKL